MQAIQELSANLTLLENLTFLHFNFMCLIKNRQMSKLSYKATLFYQHFDYNVDFKFAVLPFSELDVVG